MAYAEFEYYKNVYLCGLYALIGVEAFDFYAKEASRKIDAATDDRLSEADTIPDAVKDCVCAVAEYLYKADQAEKQATESGGSGLLTEYSNDGQSARFAADPAYLSANREARIMAIIEEYLGNTGLLYTGCEPVATEVYDRSAVNEPEP